MKYLLKFVVFRFDSVVFLEIIKSEVVFFVIDY